MREFSNVFIIALLRCTVTSADFSFAMRCFSFSLIIRTFIFLEMGEEFLASVVEFVNGISVVPKQINDKTVTVAEWLLYLKVDAKKIEEWR